MKNDDRGFLRSSLGGVEGALPLVHTHTTTKPSLFIKENRTSPQTTSIPKSHLSTSKINDVSAKDDLRGELLKYLCRSPTEEELNQYQKYGYLGGCPEEASHYKADLLKAELKKRYSEEHHEEFIEHNKTHNENFCGLYAVFHKFEHYYIRLPCKKWTCPICGKKNAADLQKRLESSEANIWPIKSHIIITVGDFEVNEHIDAIWNRVLTDLKRGGTFTMKTVRGQIKTITLPARPNLKFIKVKEFQYERFLKEGVWYRHLHVVFNQYLTNKDIIPIWNNASHADFNYIEHRHPKNFNAGKYLFKYFTKEEYQDLFIKGEKRYSASQGLIPAKARKPSSHQWEFMTLEHAQNLADAFKKDPALEIPWRFEYEIDLEALKSKYKIGVSEGWI